YSSRTQGLTARLFNITSDKEVHERIKSQNGESASRNLFDITAQKFELIGFDLPRAYETGQYRIKEMVLAQPQVAILQDQNVAASTTAGEVQEEQPSEENAPEAAPASSEADPNQDGKEEENRVMEQVAA